jgi:hypothetical protein
VSDEEFVHPIPATDEVRLKYARADHRRGGEGPSHSKYKPECCQELLDIMCVGGGYAEACAKWGITRQAFDRWLIKHPSFKDAYDRGKMLQTAWWENHLKKGESSAKVTAGIFKLKNLDPDHYLEPERLRQQLQIQSETKLNFQEIDFVSKLAEFNELDLLEKALEARAEKDGGHFFVDGEEEAEIVDDEQQD